MAGRIGVDAESIGRALSKDRCTHRKGRTPAVIVANPRYSSSHTSRAKGRNRDRPSCNLATSNWKRETDDLTHLDRQYGEDIDGH